MVSKRQPPRLGLSYRGVDVSALQLFCVFTVEYMSCQKLCLNCGWLLPTHVLQVVNDLIKLNNNYTTANVFARAGSLSNDDGDGNENGEKGIGLD